MNETEVRLFRRRMSRHPQWNESFARYVLQVQHDSGLSLCGFADLVGISAPRLYWWVKRLGEHSPKLPDTSAKPTLIPVVVKGLCDSVGQAAIAVVLRDGTRVEIHDVNDATSTWVRSLLAVGTEHARS